MDRRDFLDLRQLAHAAGQVLGAADERASPGGGRALYRVSRDAMATTWDILVPFGQAEAVRGAEAALDEIDRLEKQLTVFQEQSEVSRLNRLASSFPVPVEEGLFSLLAYAARLSEETGGAYDITTGALTRAWGFYRRRGRVPSDEERAEVLTHVGMRHVVLDTDWRTVFYRRPVEINLGSIGKGYALDRAAAVLRASWKLPAALLHGGHSSVYAIGTDPVDRRGWAVGIRHPWEAERRLAVVRLGDRALGTSAATFQHLEYNGRKLGHILDPRTGWPAEGLASVSVVAPAAADADALATAFYVMGLEEAVNYCDHHPEIGALLLAAGAADPVVVGMAQDEVELLTPTKELLPAPLGGDGLGSFPPSPLGGEGSGVRGDAS
jgi:thiamine biosynthesis lipoprotein